MRKTVLGKQPALSKNECQNKHKGIAPLRVLCLCVFRKQHPVVDIVITGNLPAVVSIEFDDRLVTGLRKKSAILMAYSREGICCFDSILAIVFRLMPVADTCYTKTTTDYRRMIRN